MSEIARRLGLVNEWIGRGVAWLTLLMVVITFTVVVLRYGFDMGSIALQESIIYLHALNFMLGAAFTLKHDAHVRVDIFYQKMEPRGRAWVDLLGTLLLLMPVCGFIFWSSWGYVADAWAVGETSGEAGGLPFVYLLKTILLLMPSLLMLQGLVIIMKAILIMGGKTPPQEHDGVQEI
ncbi:MAG: TRAP transporter small permease subunit [Gammaproteobacteria bacterium]|nr:TRAP transporter small permease subunit [Gammaproteobacteria bacterium]